VPNDSVGQPLLDVTFGHHLLEAHGLLSDEGGGDGGPLNVRVLVPSGNHLIGWLSPQGLLAAIRKAAHSLLFFRVAHV
jgi:hypothetical protein